MDRAEVERRIEDWERRLNGLYSMVEEWSKLLPQGGYHEDLRGAILQVEEDLMRKLDVPPRMLPHFAVLHGKSRVSFVPGQLWIAGTNGRVNVTNNAHQYWIVDAGGGEGAPSEWRIVTSRINNTTKPFDEEIFRQLVLHPEAEVA